MSPPGTGDLLAVIPSAHRVDRPPLATDGRRVGTGLRGEAAEEHEHELEPEVDVHAFSPGDLKRFCADAAFDDVRVKGEELLASIDGWTVRTLEASAEPDQVPWGWRRFAFRSYMARAAGGQPGAGAAAAAAALLQPAARRP